MYFKHIFCWNFLEAGKKAQSVFIFNKKKNEIVDKSKLWKFVKSKHQQTS